MGLRSWIRNKLGLKQATTGWDAAGRGRRATGWNPSGLAINALLSGNVDEIRRRARDLVRKNPWAEAALDVFVTDVVGNGIRPKPKTEDEKLRREILEAWDEWVDEADADGTSNFYGLQSLAMRSLKEAGECFFRFRPRRAGDGLTVPLQIQILEADMLDSAFHELRPGGRRIRCGIEFDMLGRRKAYHLWTQHPGELITLRAQERRPIPADEIVHLFRVLRPGQVRGIPGLATVLVKLYELDQYDDAELVRKKVAAMFGGFVTKPDADSDPLGAGAEGLDDDDVPLAALEPGTMQELGPGEDIKFADPADVGGNYEAFMKVQLRAIAKGAGTTYEKLTADLSGVNFSSIRAGLIDLRRGMDQVQRNVLIFQFCRRVWRRWFETAVLSGRIQLPAAERQNMARLLRAQWQAPGWEYVEPEKDIKAAVRRIRAGLSSRSIEAAKLGLDVEELDRQIGADNERAKALGLIFDSDPSSDQDGQARASAVGGGESGSDGESGDAGEAGQNAA